MRRLLGGVAALILLLAVVTCAKSVRVSSSKASQPSSQIAEAPSQGNATTGLNSPIRTSVPPAAAPATVSPKQTVDVGQKQTASQASIVPRENTDVSSLLALGRDSRVLPEDFKIGVLADARAGDSDEQQAMAAASLFLGGLIAGKVDSALVDPGSAGRVSDMLDFAIQRKDIPRSYRLGVPKKHESGEITASMRLLGPVGASEGEIAMARIGGRWLVTDVQISMDDLQAKQKPAERFFPSSYRWMLEE